MILHELGHFTAAKAVGMRVERFSLFFPPLLARKKIGETEYAIGSVPARRLREDQRDEPGRGASPTRFAPGPTTRQPVWKRIVVIAAGPAVNLLMAFVLLFVFFTLIGPQTTTRQVGDGRAALPGRAASSSRATASWRSTGSGGDADGAVQADRRAQVRRERHDRGLQGHRRPRR